MQAQAFGNRSTFVALHCRVHLFGTVFGGVCLGWRIRKSQTDHASLYLDMQIFKMRRTSVNIVGCCVEDVMVVAV